MVSQTGVFDIRWFTHIIIVPKIEPKPNAWNNGIAVQAVTSYGVFLYLWRQPLSVYVAMKMYKHNCNNKQTITKPHIVRAVREMYGNLGIPLTQGQ